LYHIALDLNTNQHFDGPTLVALAASVLLSGGKRSQDVGKTAW
jgi:hypothetical protein